MHESATAQERSNVLGVGVMPTTIDQTVQTLARWRDEGRQDYVCFVSVHGIVTSQRDPAMRDAINGAGLAAQDGVPLVWWSRWTGAAHAQRVCGPDVIEEMCARGGALGHRHYFYGGSPKTVEQLVKRLQQRYPTLAVAGYHSPPFRPLTPEEDEADVAAINATQPDYVWIGLGAPKQEKWMVSHLGRIKATALLGVGAAFDFSAGTKPRAPLWMQRSALEWLYRLICEPRRLARRYLIDNALFVGYAFLQLTRLRSYACDWKTTPDYRIDMDARSGDTAAAD